MPYVKCPNCGRMTFTPRCYLCGCDTGSQEPPPQKIQKPWLKIGNAILDDGWGPNNEKTLDQAISSADADTKILSVLVAILDEMRSMTKATKTETARLIRAIEAAPGKAAIALEKERQKTADKQRKANEALPPTVKVIQMPNHALARMGKHIRCMY